MSRLSSQQLVQGDGQVADTGTGGVVDGVGHGRADAGDADLPDAAGAHGCVRVGDVGPHNVDLRHVHVDGHVVVGQARVHDPPGALVEQRLLHEGQAQAHDDAAAELAGCRLGVEDAAAVERAEEPADPDLPGDRLDPHLAATVPASPTPSSVTWRPVRCAWPGTVPGTASWSMNTWPSCSVQNRRDE